MTNTTAQHSRTTAQHSRTTKLLDIALDLTLLLVILSSLFFTLAVLSSYGG